MEQLVREMFAALNAADLYLNSYDASAPSRIKAETRATVEAAIGLARQALPAEFLEPATRITPTTPGLDKILGKPRRPARGFSGDNA